MKKTKFQEMLEKTKKKLKSQEEISGGNNKINREYTPFFNPNKILKNSKKVTARILPIQSSDTFYITYPKHKFSIGSNFFNLICAHAEFNKGKAYGNCPICNFLKDNNGNIERNVYGKLMARDSHLCYVWNYNEERIEKFNFDDNILREIVEYLIDNDITEDSDGFDIIFIKTEDEKFYKIKDIKIPQDDIDEFMDENKIDEIPNIIDTELSFNTQFVVKRLKDTLDLAIKSFIPDFEDLDLSSLNNVSKMKKSSRNDDEDEVNEEELFNDKKSKSSNKTNKTENSKHSKKQNKNENDEDIEEFDNMFNDEEDNESTNEDDPF